MHGLDGPEKLVIVPIFAALPPEQQARVFEDAPVGSRKVIEQSCEMGNIRCKVVVAYSASKDLFETLLAWQA